MSAVYQFRVRGHLDPQVCAWFGDFTSAQSGSDTLLTGIVTDQAALYGVIERFRDLGITLLAVNAFPDASDESTSESKDRGESKAIMNWIHAEASDVSEARPEQVYAVISDYRVSHPAIVPKRYFGALTVEKGGQGAGTVVRGTVKVFGNVYPLHQLVSEPEPGHILRETDIETQQYTTFTFEPLDNGRQTRLTIASEFPPTPGIAGLMMRLMLPGTIRRIYREELQQINEYVKGKAKAG